MTVAPQSLVTLAPHVAANVPGQAEASVWQHFAVEPTSWQTPLHAAVVTAVPVALQVLSVLPVHQVLFGVQA
jgi:hypothetical protein